MENDSHIKIRFFGY